METTLKSAKKTVVIGPDKPTVVQVKRPILGELVEFVNAPGQIEPKKKVSIRSRISW